MELSDDMCNNLIKWLQTLELSKTVHSVEELSDGVLLAEALFQIAPDYFVRLNSNIHTDIGTNWRLKVNNLKKIIKCLEEYYQDVLNLHLTDMAKPDLLKIGETNDPKELGKMLRLILGCAVNCNAKQEYITRIMAMEESVQQNIMQAIQQLEEVTHGRGRSSLSLIGLETDGKFQRILAELEIATEMKDMLSQKCHNFESQIACLTEEKSILTMENNRLVKKLKEIEMSCPRDDPDGIMRNTEMRRQIESLKEELFKIETQKDDYRLKILEQEKEIQLLHEKNVELQSTADKAAQLKDDIDALTETAEKAKALEITVSSYKKKLEEFADLKKKYKTLKDENNEYYQQNIQYQEEIKRNNFFKSQSELYKKQVTELHQKIEEESQKCDKLTFENKKLQSKLLMVQREKESLIEERDGLKELNEELHCQRQKSEEKNAVANELAPTELQARIKYLEKENQSLRFNSEETMAKQLFYEDMQSRLEKSLEQNRNYNHRILELEAQVEELTKGISGCSSGSSAEQQQQQEIDELTMYRNKCITLQNALTNKENELQTATTRYKKNLEKANDVIKQLEPDVSNLTNKALKMPQRSSEEDHFAAKREEGIMREQEERLITSSFYKFMTSCQRDAVDDRLALLTHRQSFLARQRQSVPRKSIQPFRSK